MTNNKLCNDCDEQPYCLKLCAEAVKTQLQDDSGNYSKIEYKAKNTLTGFYPRMTGGLNNFK